MVDGPFGFPEAAEVLLTESLPNYPRERILFKFKLAGVLIFFLFILPVLMMKRVKVERKEESKIVSEEAMNGKPKRKCKRKKSRKNQEEKQQLELTNDQKMGCDDDKEVIYSDHPMSSFFSVLGCLIFLPLVLIRSSPDNYYAPNGVFQAPLLTKEECKQILDMADTAAAVNYARAELVGGDSRANETIKNLLKEPQGWQKLRHSSYPTTDLNLITDPFTNENRDYIKQKMDARLSPILQRIFGVPPSAIRATDMFVVRYDANKRTFLANHTDDGKISFNVLLDDNFEGGGTLFWNRAQGEPFAYVKPTQIGQVLMHSALLNHEGVHVKRGRRTILVGFLEVDRVNPLSGKGQIQTGLSFFSSWGSLPWIINKLKQEYFAAHQRLRQDEENWKNNMHVRSFFAMSFRWLGVASDVLLPHFERNLVEDKNREAFLAALDSAYKRNTMEGGNANWFSGQQVNIDTDGKVSHSRRTRQNNGHRFDEL